MKSDNIFLNESSLLFKLHLNVWSSSYLMQFFLSYRGKVYKLNDLICVLLDRITYNTWIINTWIHTMYM